MLNQCRVFFPRTYRPSLPFTLQFELHILFKKLLIDMRSKIAHCKTDESPQEDIKNYSKNYARMHP